MVESPAQSGRLRTLIHPGPVSGVHVKRNPTVRNLRKLLEVELAALPEVDQQQYFRQR
jgi:hypothetical protein